MKDFITTFLFLQRFNCLEAIDSMFLKIIKEDWSIESLETNQLLIVTFLRSNFYFKDQLSHYNVFLEQSVLNIL